jgi:hypothetical protein
LRPEVGVLTARSHHVGMRAAVLDSAVVREHHDVVGSVHAHSKQKK